MWVSPESLGRVPLLRSHGATPQRSRAFRKTDKQVTM
jgi:hypothetical protein